MTADKEPKYEIDFEYNAILYYPDGREYTQYECETEHELTEIRVVWNEWIDRGNTGHYIKVKRRAVIRTDWEEFNG